MEQTPIDMGIYAVILGFIVILFIGLAMMYLNKKNQRKNQAK